MKRDTIKVLAVLALMGMLANGCARRVVVHEQVAAPTAGEVVVSTEPPAPKHEVVGRAPGSGYVWIEGYWARTHDHWVWIKGHYELAPRERAVWAKGHWDRTDRGWVWVPGHWA